MGHGQDFIAADQAGPEWAAVHRQMRPGLINGPAHENRVGLEAVG